MSETDSFIQEVTEEVRQDRMFALWKKWGPAILGGVALIVGSAAAWNWMKAQEQAEAEELGGRFLAAEPADLAAQQELAAFADGSARVLAELSLAATRAETGDRDGAIALFEEIAARADLERGYADLAQLQALRLRSETDPGGAIDGLAALSGDDRPFRLLAIELGAVLKLNSGDTDGAHADLNAILADPSATEAMRLRAIAILTSSGGTVEDPSG